MSVLNTARLWFGFGTEPQPVLKPRTPTLEERLGEAAAERGYAMGLVEEAAEALRDAAETEAEVAGESLRRADQALQSAKEAAARIIASGEMSSGLYTRQAAAASRDSIDDSDAAFTLLGLLKDDDAA